MPGHSEVHFCTSADGTRLAVAVSGSGPAVVAVRLWSAYEVLEAPNFKTRHWAEALSRHFLYVRFDARGIGLSERQITRLTLDAWVEDLEAVVDAIDRQPVALIAFSHAAAVAIRYAVRHPDRVSRLAIYGGCARGLLRRSDDEQALKAARTMIQMAETAFGDYGPLGASFRLSFYLRWRPQFTREQLEVNDADVLERIGKVGFDYAAAAHDVDVSSEARQVSCPTLIFHARDDTFIPFDEGRLLAALIPNATLVALPCANHQPLEGDPEWPVVLDDLKEFLAPGSTGGSPHVDAPHGGSTFRLTVRQIEVLRLIGQGQTDKQIARALGLSHRTVEMHVSRVLQALNCSTRAEAVRIAAEQGLLG